MDSQAFDFKPDEPELSEELRAAMSKAEAALKRMWEREKREAEAVYEITIPGQTLTVVGKDRAEQVLRTLKSARLSGTYRVTKK